MIFQHKSVVCTHVQTHRFAEWSVECGAPDVDWATVPDQKAPAGWVGEGFIKGFGDRENCANGWSALAGISQTGRLFTSLKGSGEATAKYSDCNKGGFVGLWLNNKRIDQTKQGTDEVREFRCGGRVLSPLKHAKGKSRDCPAFPLMHYPALSSSTAMW